MNPVDLVALDIAGTTLDEGGTVYRVLHDCVLAAGSTAGADDVQAWMGADKRQAVHMLLRIGATCEPSPATVEKVFADFSTRLAAAYLRHPPEPFPGVREAFQVLREQGIAIALTTGFDRSIAEPILDAVGWSEAGVLDTVVCSDDVPAGRPAPYMIHRAMERTGVTDVRRVLAAGDTVLDLEAGVNAGVGFVVGVLTGAMDAVSLGASRHTHLLTSIAQLPALLDLSG